jgi:hypothetical protein
VNTLTGTIVEQDGLYWVFEADEAPRYLSRLFILPSSCNVPVALGSRVKLKFGGNSNAMGWRVVAELPQK